MVSWSLSNESGGGVTWGRGRLGSHLSFIDFLYYGIIKKLNNQLRIATRKRVTYHELMNNL